MPPDSRARFDWLHWLIAALPFGLVVLVGSLIMLFAVFRPGRAAETARGRVDTQLAVLGPLSKAERSIIAVLLVTLAGWIAAPYLGLEVGTVAILGLLGAVLTGNFDRSSFKELDWNYLIFYGVALSLAGLIVALKLDQGAAELIGALFGRLGTGPLTLVLGVAAISLITRLVIGQDHGALLLSLALIPVAPTMGADPWVVVVTLAATSTLWFLPNQTPTYLVAYAASEGRLYSHAQARRAAFGYTVVTLLGLVVSVPYWHLLGLL
jgi:di/tricarboxylate transporter